MTIPEPPATVADAAGAVLARLKKGAASLDQLAQDVRGIFKSEGEYFPFESDMPDGYDTIEWIGAQPWSNGRVGMFGLSYLGTVQWLAAKERPPRQVLLRDDHRLLLLRRRT